jgi:hypothetical protein
MSAAVTGMKRNPQAEQRSIALPGVAVPDTGWRQLGQETLFSAIGTDPALLGDLYKPTGRLAGMQSKLVRRTVLVAAVTAWLHEKNDRKKSLKYHQHGGGDQTERTVREIQRLEYCQRHHVAKELARKEQSHRSAVDCHQPAAQWVPFLVNEPVLILDRHVHVECRHGGNEQPHRGKHPSGDIDF